jgi:hypothetical protein
VARIFALRVLKSSWGIAIDLQARSCVVEASPAGLVRGGSRTWMDISRVVLDERDALELALGMSRVAPMIERVRPDGHVIIEVLSVQFTPTDYQPEGMAAAMVGWATEEFNWTHRSSMLTSIRPVTSTSFVGKTTRRRDVGARGPDCV